MTEERLVRLAEVFQVVFGMPPDANPTQARQGSMPAWDSLGHVTLVSAISSEFDVEISAIDSLEVTSFDAAATLLGELLREPTR